jgi:acyl-CoA synthetase
MMVEAAERGDHQLPHIKAMTCGGSPIPETLVDRARQHLGIEVLRAYGLSECLSAAVMRTTDPQDARAHCDGWPILNTDVEIFADDGTILPRGKRGICGLRGPSLFVGYFGDHAQTQAAFGPTGFLMTGDVAVRDEDGFLKIVGRAKDFIIRGGLNIDPVEIEELLREHPAVAEAAVVGYADETLGERICACVALRDGHAFSMEDMTTFLLGKGLSRTKVPERLLEVDRIPMSDVGKPLKSKIREMLV